MLTFKESSHRYKMSDAEGKLLPVTGATTLLGGGIPKPALIRWAPRVVAEYVHENPREIERLRGLPEVDYKGGTRPALIDELCKVPDRLRDTAGVRGTQIHHLAERIINGEEVEVPDEHLAEVTGYVEFLDLWDITPVLTEVSVGHRTHWYAGRLDLICTSPHLNDGHPILVDLKTSNGVYGETALQTAAYASAEFYVDDEHPETEIPLPEIAATYVAHITPAGTHLYPLCRDRAAIAQAQTMFLAAAYTAKTAKTRDGFITEPLPHPSATDQKAA